MSLADPLRIIDFWFKETPAELWFASDAALDAAIRQRFEETWRAAHEGKLCHWAESAEGALALILLLDQFPRNMFRNKPAAFASDSLARTVAQEAIARGFDLACSGDARTFFYMPCQHSENLADQETGLRLIRERLGERHFSYPYAVRHHSTIARFGRFPARNAILGRSSTREERDFLEANPIGF